MIIDYTRMVDKLIVIVMVLALFGMSISNIDYYQQPEIEYELNIHFEGGAKLSFENNAPFLNLTRNNLTSDIEDLWLWGTVYFENYTIQYVSFSYNIKMTWFSSIHHSSSQINFSDHLLFIEVYVQVNSHFLMSEIVQITREILPAIIMVTIILHRINTKQMEGIL